MKKLFLVLTFCPLVASAQSWSNQYTGAVYDISFPDSLHGWAAGGKNTAGNGRVLASNDEGTTWNEQIINFTSSISDSFCTINDIAFFDSLHGWAGGAWSKWIVGPNRYHCNYLFIKTTNGFSTYSIKKGTVENYTTGFTEDMEIASDSLLWTYFYGDLNGYIYGMCMNDPRGGQYTPGGYTSWSGPTLEMGFIDAYNGWCIKNNELYQTTNSFWGVVHLYDFSTSFYGIDFIDSLHGWIVGSGGKILYTDNGGIDTAWDTLSSGVTKTLHYVKFVDSLNGWTGGDNVILRTRDGGQTWITEATPEGTISKICASDTSHAWAVISGTSGSILKYHPYTAIEESSPRSSLLTPHFSVSPNPFINSTLINYDLPFTNCHLQVSVYDLSGQLVEQTDNPIIGKNLKSGIYFVKINNSKPIKIIKMGSVK